MRSPINVVIVVHKESRNSNIFKWEANISPHPQTGWIGPIGPPRKIDKFYSLFGFFRSMEKMAWDGPKWGQEDFFPANPDLADILCRTDLEFENFNFFHFVDPKFLDFQVPRSPNSLISWVCCEELHPPLDALDFLCNHTIHGLHLGKTSVASRRR